MKFQNYFVSDIPRREFLKKTLKGGVAVASMPALLTFLKSCGTQQPSAKVNVDPALLNRTIRKALEKGGEFAEVYVENRISRNIRMEESKFRSATFDISMGAGVRVISGDKTGYAYTDEITEEKLMRAAEVASYVARGSKIVEPVNLFILNQK